MLLPFSNQELIAILMYERVQSLLSKVAEKVCCNQKCETHKAIAKFNEGIVIKQLNNVKTSP